MNSCRHVYFSAVQSLNMWRILIFFFPQDQYIVTRFKNKNLKIVRLHTLINKFEHLNIDLNWFRTFLTEHRNTVFDNFEQRDFLIVLVQHVFNGKYIDILISYRIWTKKLYKKLIIGGLMSRQIWENTKKQRNTYE